MGTDGEESVLEGPQRFGRCSEVARIVRPLGPRDFVQVLCPIRDGVRRARLLRSDSGQPCET